MITYQPHMCTYMHGIHTEPSSMLHTRVVPTVPQVPRERMDSEREIRISLAPLEKFCRQ